MERDADRPIRTRLSYISTHTLTWSVTPIADCEACEVADFNSHAHVERDLLAGIHVRHAVISTHTLTWSVTGKNWAGEVTDT